jgi:hypothetical protein
MHYQAYSRQQSIYIFRIVLPSVSELWTEDSLETAPLPRALARLPTVSSNGMYLTPSTSVALEPSRAFMSLRRSSWVLSLPTGMLGGSGKRLCRTYRRVRALPELVQG